MVVRDPNIVLGPYYGTIHLWGTGQSYWKSPARTLWFGLVRCLP